MAASPPYQSGEKKTKKKNLRILISVLVLFVIENASYAFEYLLAFCTLLTLDMVTFRFC